MLPIASLDFRCANYMKRNFARRFALRATVSDRHE